MVHRQKGVDIKGLITYWKTYVIKAIFFCENANTLVESQVQQVLEFLELALELDTNYNEIDGISRDTLDFSGD